MEQQWVSCCGLQHLSEVLPEMSPGSGLGDRGFERWRDPSLAESRILAGRANTESARFLGLVP